MKIYKFTWTRIRIIITAKIVQWRRFKKKYLGKYTYVCVYLFIIDENVDIKFSAHDVFPVQASSGTFVLSKLTDFRSKKKKILYVNEIWFSYKNHMFDMWKANVEKIKNILWYYLNV